jgi:methylenetetrahydrofolate dehydrogenase (NADP+) / methenyltetrahydrofolate cyclohydrolase
MTILDGKSTSLEIQQELAEKVRLMKEKGMRAPHLAAILVGNDGASQTYVNAKVQACENIGFTSTLLHLSADTTETELLEKIEQLNTNTDIDGFIVQLPLPEHINETKVTLAIAPSKDVDGFHPENIGRMNLGLPCYLPATPNGIIELLKRYNVPTEGKHCVVIGRSHIVGTPMSILLSRNTNPGNCTVTMTHSKTVNLKEICLQADIIIAALGRAEFVTGDMIKMGATVIDVGITRLDDPSREKGFRLAGDVKFDEVAQKCDFITPVPGGVGPMTIASLLQNTMKAFYFHHSTH